MARDKYSTQIARFDGRNVFVEVLNNAFQIGKVQMNFIEYDGSTNKQKRKLDLFMDIGKALVLSQDILSGKLAKTIELAKRDGTFEGKAVNDYTSYFTDMGGQNEEKVKRNLAKLSKDYSWLTEGMALSKQFKIQAGKKIPWIFRAEYGVGETNSTGLIVPKGMAKESINIPLTDENIKEFAIIVQMHIQAYFNQFYVKYNKELFPNDKVNVYKPTEK